eukprot:scaffold496197_cov46-Prasinocladus_malaysianus.AAC.1
MSDAEAEVERATAALFRTKAEAEDSLALADKASMAYRPQESESRGVTSERTGGEASRAGEEAVRGDQQQGVHVEGQRTHDC